MNLNPRLFRGMLSALSPAGARGKLTILQFHRVPAQVDPLSPTEMGQVEFEKILDFFMSCTRILPLGEATRALARNKLPDRAVALTFDDGYAEWVDVISPVLRSRNLHATFFVTTEQLTGATMWHERINAAVRALPEQAAVLPYGFGSFADLRVFKHRARLALELQERFKYVPLAERNLAIAALEAQATVPLERPQSFDEASVRHLHNQGFDIGGHTIHHPILNQSDDAEALAEIGGSKERLEGIIGAPVTLFAYPNGRPLRDFSTRHVEMVKACGYHAAVITGGGVAQGSSDPFQLPRFTPWGNEPTRMALQVARNLLTRPALYSTDQPVTRKPSVLFVENGSGFGGAIVALQTLLTHLPAKEFDCHVVSNFPVGDFATLPPVRSHRVISDQFVNTRSLAQRIRALGQGRWVRALLFVTGRLDDLVNRLPYVTRLLVHALWVRPDIIHGNNEPASNREAMFVARLLNKGYVQHLRGPTTASRHTPWLLQQPAIFIPVSRWLGDELLKGGVASAQIRQIYDAVELSPSRAPANPARPSLRRELALEEDVVLVAMVGMLLAWKGQQQFIEAVSLLPQGAARVVFLVVGGTPERGDDEYASGLRAQVAQLGLQDRVRFTGHRSDLAELLPQINVVVSASIEPEPLGLVMLEAMVNGAVFVGPAHGAAIEVVTDGDNGFLFEPRSSASLAIKLGQAIEASQHPGALTDKARHAVLDCFSGQRCAGETMRVYQSLMYGAASHP